MNKDVWCSTAHSDVGEGANGRGCKLNPQRRAQCGGRLRSHQQPMQQHGLNGEPRQHAGTEGKLSPIRMAERRDYGRRDETACHGRQVEHGCCSARTRSPCQSWPARQTPKLSVKTKPVTKMML